MVSQLTKILTPASDLDIAVLGVPEDAADHPTEVYLKLAERFRAEAARSGMATYVEAIVKAKVPIVKLDHARSGLSVDICINNDSGSRTGALIRRYVREYPPLRPLTLVLKLFLVSAFAFFHILFETSYYGESMQQICINVMLYRFRSAKYYDSSVSLHLYSQCEVL